MTQATPAAAASPVTPPRKRQMRGPTRRFRYASAVRSGMALSLAGMLVPTAASAATKVTCSPTQVTAVYSDTFRNTTSTAFVPLTEAGGKFVQGGSRPSCVIVRFEGYAATSNNAVLTIAGFIGAKPLAPDQVQLTAGVFYEPRAWTFIIPSVKPGEHRIRFQFRTNDGNNSVGFNVTNTIIYHTP